MCKILIIYWLLFLLQLGKCPSRRSPGLYVDHVTIGIQICSACNDRSREYCVGSVLSIIQLKV